MAAKKKTTLPSPPKAAPEHSSASAAHAALSADALLADVTLLLQELLRDAKDKPQSEALGRLLSGMRILMQAVEYEKKKSEKQKPKSIWEVHSDAVEYIEKNIMGIDRKRTDEK